MSYQEKNKTVEITSYLLIFGYYLLKLIPMYREGRLDASTLFGLWVTVIVATILVNIIASILTHIGLSIVHAIRTREEPVVTDLTDERDQLIELKGTRVSYIFYSLGVFLSMLSLVFDHPPLVMFSLLILSGITAEIIGGFSQLYLYRRGV
jgi:hypothetical protein